MYTNEIFLIVFFPIIVGFTRFRGRTRCHWRARGKGLYCLVIVLEPLPSSFSTNVQINGHTQPLFTGDKSILSETAGDANM